MTYSATGSTGDGYKFAKNFGHRISNVYPGLVPLVLKDEYIKELEGLSLKNVKLVALQNEKVYEEFFGEMIFTHFGISGPIVLSCSSYINKYDLKDLSLTLDLKPALTEEQLDLRIQRDFLKFKHKDLQNSLVELLPKSLIKVIIELSNIPYYKKTDVITKQERKSLLDSIKSINLTITSLRPIKEAIITSGGVDVKEINPKTMESKLVKGLYFAGEIIDVDALTGGYNLQIAYSTGYTAGNARSES